MKRKGREAARNALSTFNNLGFFPSSFSKGKKKTQKALSLWEAFATDSNCNNKKLFSL
jgi:hypothetical protein